MKDSSGAGSKPPVGGLSFTYNGRTIEASAKDTIASALYRRGIRIFSRSVKYHRPRGLTCVAGHCTACMVEVDGVPDVRACTALARPCKVRSQNVFPSVKWDLFSITDYAFPKNFEYQRRFLRPKSVNRAFYWLVRRMAGVGRFKGDERPSTAAALETMETEVLVIGGGVAGMAAAKASAEKGARTMLVASGLELGGAALHATMRVRSAKGVIATLPSSVLAWTGSTALGYYDGMVLVERGGRLVEVRPRSVVVAVGGHEATPLFPNCDLPGVISARVVRYLWGRFGVPPGKRAIVDLGPNGDEGVVSDIAAAGTQVVKVIRTDAETTQGERSIVRAHGFTTLKAVTVDQDGRPERIKCDLYVYAHGARPAPELFQQAGCRMRYSENLGAYVPETDAVGTTSNERVFAAGLSAGYTDVDECLRSGGLAGAKAADMANMDGRIGAGKGAEVPAR
ncbi:MAG: (2Fe-2S)-binding protein [Euryarchaeota archaeon]|nr:(2Fe-2S)-binding protein [Euryarchaeota archaeon]